MTARNSIFGDGWKGGSGKAAVRGYVTRSGKRVKAHTRRVARKQAQRTSKATLGPALTKAFFGKGETFLRRLGNAVAAELMNSNRNRGN